MGDDERPGGGEGQHESSGAAESLERAMAGVSVSDAQVVVKDHAFWETQPVGQLKAELDRAGPEGAIDEPMGVDGVKQDAYKLPDSFEWSSCDMTDAKTKGEVFDLLAANYVEDDDEMFRFQYSQEFLKWALQPPGYHVDWHLGVRVKGTGKLVAFITGVPATLMVKGITLELAEINFLCIHKKLRAKRLAPMLIREITRRVNLRGVFQAAYTAGVVLPKPIAQARYWHRSLNVKKLIEIGFTHLHARMTMARTIKLFKLDSEPATPGIREMTDADLPAVTVLLHAHLRRFPVAPVFNEAEVRHLLSPREGVVYSFVVEDPESPGSITDFVSFYSLPSTVIKSATQCTLRAAYSYYNVATKATIQRLMEDALILAKQRDFDVFNALDLMDNAQFLEDLRFGIGDGNLQYYLYNWRISSQLEPADIGLVLT
jgi:glycylpeptide N-tetradecanoyltransferase